LCSQPAEVCRQPKSRRRQVEHGAVNIMQFRYRAAVAALFSVVACIQASTAFAVEHTAARHHRAPHHNVIKMPTDYTAWSRVANCEAGGWQVLGAAYPDSLGITRTNFVDYGGAPQPVGHATRAEIIAQIHAADRLIRSYHVGIPDQGGCAAW
jgi:hypothetical protein